MFQRIWSGVSRVGEALYSLADSINGLSAICNQASAQLRTHMDEQPAALPAPPPQVVIEQQPTVEEPTKGSRRKTATA